MSRRHPLSSTEPPELKSASTKQIVPKALVTCRHQAAGNFLKARLLLLLGDLAGLLRSLLHCALRLLRLLSFLGHVALLSEIALVAACTRESKCTTSRIHQHIQKNSVPLKEVLTQQCVSARRADIGDTTTCSHANAKSAATTDVGICQYRRKRLCPSAFFNSRYLRSMRNRRRRDSAIAPKSRDRGL